MVIHQQQEQMKDKRKETTPDVSASDALLLFKKPESKSPKNPLVIMFITVLSDIRYERVTPWISPRRRRHH